MRLLRDEGDFLVRETTRNDESQTSFVLSVCWNGHKHFIIQTTAEVYYLIQINTLDIRIIFLIKFQGHYRFEGPSFPTIQELILHQYQSETSVTNRSGTILKVSVKIF